MQLRRRLRKGKGLLYALGGILLLCVYARFLPIYLSLKSLLRKEDCPACYADNMCVQFQSGEFELVGWDRYALQSWLNQRNVYQAVWKPLSQAVVLKNLGSNQELAELNKKICKFAGTSTDTCVPGKVIESVENRVMLHNSDLRGLDEGELSLVTINLKTLKTIDIFQDIDVLECVQDQGMMNWLVHHALHHSSTPHLHNILTILLMNQEPLIPMILPQNKGWPFPEYFGGCGRLAVFQYIGQPLDSYYSYPWHLRAHFALQLLKMAQQFSRNKHNLAIYPTDWSANNFAVDWSSKLVYLVDMENIILVNQTRILHQRAPGWDVQHAADSSNCKNCFSFHVQDLCTHAATDHNYHGVCGGLLRRSPYSPGIPGGILHSPPSDVVTRHPELQDRIEECATSSKPGGREQVAKLIIEILQSELQDFDINQFD